MAVAPLPNVEAVLRYALSVIPSEKIYLGIPNYGYDWPLPYVRGATKADEAAQSPYFRNTRDGAVHEVWFEDARSMSAKLRLIARRGLRGAGYWNLMRPYPQGWTVLNALYDVL